MVFAKDVVKLALLLAVLALVVGLMDLVRHVDATVQAVPVEIAATRAAFITEVQSTRRELLATVNTQAGAIRHDALETVQHDLLAKADARLGEALGEVHGIRADLQPVLANAANLEAQYTALGKDAQDSLDDSYPDIKASVESATVAITSAAHASEAVRDAAPKVAASVVGIGQSADAVATDVRRELDAAVAPKKWWQKVLGPLYVAARISASFL